jgi:iron complex outermembrane receptor protein
MRVTAYYNALAGYTDAIQPGGGVEKDVNTGSRTGARVAMKFAPNDRFTITPRFFYQKIKMDGWNRQDIFNILGNPFTTTEPRVTLGDRQVFTQIDEPYTDKFTLADLNLSYDFGGLALTSITSYIDRDVLVVRDATALTASVNGGTLGLRSFCPRCNAPDTYRLDAPLDDATQVQTWTEELRLGGTSGALQWVTGAFYSTTDKHYGQSLIVDGFEEHSQIAFGTAFTFNQTNELYFSKLDYNLDQWAVFGEGTWKVSDRFNITGGLRWYDFNEDKVQIFDGLFADFGGEVNVSSTSADGLAPRLIASWAVSPLTRLNAQVSRGFRLGGVNDPLLRDLCQPADLATFGRFTKWNDETAWNYEVGTKSTILGGKGSFNASLFYMDISDLQTVVTAGTCSSRIVVNIPQAHSAGLELELAAATSEHFDFSISASYNNSELDSTVGASSARDTGLLEGNRLPSVPKFQASASATYQWTVSQNALGYLTGTYQHVGSRFTQLGDEVAGYGTFRIDQFPYNIGAPFTQNTFSFDPELPAYDLVNVRLGFIWGPWDAALYVNNVTDENARLSLDRERGRLARVGYLTNQPRTFGLTTRVRF